MWKQRNKEPTIVLEMDDKIQMFCLAAAKLSSALSVQRLGKERFSPEPEVTLWTRQQEWRQEDSLTLKMSGNKKGSVLGFPQPRFCGGKEERRELIYCAGDGGVIPIPGSIQPIIAFSSFCPFCPNFPFSRF